MGINWEVRIRNKDFWLAVIPALLLFLQAVGTPFGFRWDFDILDDQLLAIVETGFAVLTLMGVVNDPTTESFRDSARALTYEVPKPKHYLGGE